jgi:hypothetical protein
VGYSGNYDGLPNDAGVVQLRDSTTGEVVDQVAYGGETTLDGWTAGDGSALPEEELIGRVTEDDAFVDTNASADWSRVGEDTFFGTTAGNGGGNGQGNGGGNGQGNSGSPPGRT